MDTKGLKASCLAAMPDLVAMRLPRPIHLFIFYDEKVDASGARRLVEEIGLQHYKPTQDGLFLKPMVVTDFDHGSGFARDEIFGPVMSIRTFDTEDEAYALANDTQYGLAASGSEAARPESPGSTS